MSRRTALTIIGAVLVAAVLLALVVERRRSRPAVSESAAPALTAAEVPRVLTLYFPDGGDRLEVEQRRIPAGLAGPELARRVLAELLDGPTEDGLFRPLPEGTRVDFVEPAEAGTLWVSLAPAEGERPPRYGSREEILAVYSLVNTLCANVPEVDRIAFLWNGVEPTTFAGHVDTRHPLAPEPRWNRSSE